MKDVQDSRREHSRTRFAREQLLHVKKEERLASLAKNDCEERIRLLMEELQGGTKFNRHLGSRVQIRDEFGDSYSARELQVKTYLATPSMISRAYQKGLRVGDGALKLVQI